jgi:hypothetical protein
VRLIHYPRICHDYVKSWIPIAILIETCVETIAIIHVDHLSELDVAVWRQFYVTEVRPGNNHGAGFERFAACPVAPFVPKARDRECRRTVARYSFSGFFSLAELGGGDAGFAAGWPAGAGVACGGASDAGDGCAAGALGGGEGACRAAGCS